MRFPVIFGAEGKSSLSAFVGGGCRDFSVLLSTLVSSLRVCRILGIEVPQFVVLLLQPIQELRKPHIDPLRICAKLLEFRVDGFHLYYYTASFFGESDVPSSLLKCPR